MRRILPLAGLSLSLLLVACQTVNTTSGGAVGVQRKQYMFSMLSEQQVNQMYAQSYAKTVSEAKSAGKLANDTADGKRVAAIAKRLIPQTAAFRPDAVNWDWQVNLVQSDELNANCGPGGKIFVYSGLIDQLKLTDDELAAVMGHEIAHALREHSREQMSRAYAIQMGENLGGALLGVGQGGFVHGRVDLVQLLARLDLAAFGEQALLNDAVDLWAHLGDAIGAGAPRHFTGQCEGFGFERDYPDLRGLLGLWGAGFLAAGETEHCHGDGGNQDSEGWLRVHLRTSFVSNHGPRGAKGAKAGEKSMQEYTYMCECL